MLKNYLTVALRALRQQRLYAAINVLGLAVGLACAILIFLFVRDELTYDQIHTERDRIFRMVRQSVDQEGIPHSHDVYLPYAVAQTLKDEIPEVEATVQLYSAATFIRVGEATYEERGLLASADFFNVFTFPLILGNPETALSQPNGLVLTQAMAEQLYGDAWRQALGKRLEVQVADDFADFTISAIAENPPGNATIQFQYLLPFEYFFEAYPDYESDRTDWGSSWIVTYAMLRQGADPAVFQDKLQAFRQRHYPDELTNYQNERGWESQVWPATYIAQPQADIHLNYEIGGGITEPSNPEYSYNLGYMAAALLLIAIINFMTLAIGRSAKRGKEVAMRKVIGAQRRQVMGQFWVESVLLATLSLLLAVALAALLLPSFNAFADKTLSLGGLLHPVSLLFLVGITLFTGLVAGSYPALVLSNFKPLDIFRNRLKLGGSNLFTKGLVVGQFTISSALLLGSFIMMQQLNYLRTKDLGFNDEQVIVVPNRTFGNQTVLQHYQNQLASNTQVQEIAGVMTSFARGSATTGWLHNEEMYSARVFPATANYVQTLELEFLEGRNFNPELSSDSTKVIVNEAFLRMFNWDYGVGQTIPSFERPRANLVEPEIIGVVKDYQYQSLQEAVYPLVIYIGPANRYRQVLVKVAPNQIRETVADLEAAWNQITDGVPFEYSFLDEDMDRQYSSDERWGSIINSVAGLTLFVACLGLFGLAALTIRGRVRELGIRKILGASGWHLAWVILRTLTLLIALGLLLGIPLSSYLMHGWLQNYAFRVALPGWVYALPVIVLAGVSLATLSFHLLRAQRMNPVDSLRAE